MSAHRPRSRPTASRDPIRDRIVQAIVNLAGSHGYEATTVDAICGLADVPLSEFSSRFTSKEACFLDAHDEMSLDFGKRVLAAYNSHTAWHDKVWAAGWAAIDFLREDPVRARFFAVEINCAGTAAVQRRDLIMQAFVDLLDAGREELEDPESLTRATAEIVAGAIYYTIQNRILEGCIDRGEDFLVDLVYVAVLPYLGAGAAEAELRVQTLR